MYFLIFSLIGTYYFCRKKEIYIFQDYGIHRLVGAKYHSHYSVHCFVGCGWNPVTCLSQTPLPAGRVKCCQWEALVGNWMKRGRPPVKKKKLLAVAVAGNSNSISDWGIGQLQQHQQLHTAWVARYITTAFYLPSLTSVPDFLQLLTSRLPCLPLFVSPTFPTFL